VANSIALYGALLLLQRKSTARAIDEDVHCGAEFPGSPRTELSQQVNGQNRSDAIFMQDVPQGGFTRICG
jgi:TPP-dependent indolepyruvate ferredoxin oxidoreductase alpha subunit